MTKTHGIDKGRLKLIILDLIQGPINEKTDYSIVIEYTALPERFGCKVCADFHADFGYTAKASKGKLSTKFRNSHRWWGYLNPYP